MKYADVVKAHESGTPVYVCSVGQWNGQREIPAECAYTIDDTTRYSDSWIRTRVHPSDKGALFAVRQVRARNEQVAPIMYVRMSTIRGAYSAVAPVREALIKVERDRRDAAYDARRAECAKRHQVIGDLAALGITAHAGVGRTVVLDLPAAQALVSRLTEEPAEPSVGLCGDRTEHAPHLVASGSLGRYLCHADQSRRLPARAERDRSSQNGESDGSTQA